MINICLLIKHRPKKITAHMKMSLNVTEINSFKW